jgi:hypothetical protein
MLSHGIWRKNYLSRTARRFDNSGLRVVRKPLNLQQIKLHDFPEI